MRSPGTGRAFAGSLLAATNGKLYFFGVSCLYIECVAYMYIQKATASAADLSKSRLSAVWLRFWGPLLEALADPGRSLQGLSGFGVHWARQGSQSRLFGTPVQAGAPISRPGGGGGGSRSNVVWQPVAACGGKVSPL